MTHMRRVRTMECVLVATTLVVTLVCGSAFAISANDRRKIIILKDISLKSPLGSTTAELLVTATGSRVIHEFLFINALAVELPSNDITDALAKLANSLYVLEVVDDLLTVVDPICPSDTLLPVPEIYPWGLQRINVPEVHRQWPTEEGSGVTVAVLDTGINSYHRVPVVGEYSQGMAKGYNVLASEASPIDDHGHGTHIAGIIAATWNGLGEGIIGAAPQARIAAVKVLDKNGVGYVSDVIKGLEWVYNKGFRVVNMSFGFRSDSSALRRAIKALADNDVIMVASAGNRCAAKEASEDGGGDDCNGGPAASCSAPLTAITYPAAYRGVLAVGATDSDDHVTAYSLSGPKLDVVAPGGAPNNGQILSTNKPIVTPLGLAIYGLGHGTSQAAAHVTGAVALALQLKPGLSYAAVRDLLTTTAVDLKYSSERQGAGRIDAETMIKKLLP
jgi:subtilisin family serine protease